MTTTYTTADCVEEQMLASLKSRIESMEATLKDKLASGDVTLDNPATIINSKFESECGEIFRSDPKEASWEINRVIPPTVKSSSVTPNRKFVGSEARSVQNSNFEYQKQTQNQTSSHQAQNLGKMINETGVFTRCDLNKLKERLRKALPTQEDQVKISISNGQPLKAKDKMSQIAISVDDGPTKAKPYGIFKTEPTASQHTFEDKAKDHISEVSYTKNYKDLLHSSRKKTDPIIDFNLKCKTVTPDNNFLRQYSSDSIHSNSYYQRMEELETKISRLQKENSNAGKHLEKKSNTNKTLDQSSLKFQTPRSSYQEKKDGERSLNTALKSNINMLLKPSERIKIPAYLMANKIGRPSAKVYFQSSRKESTEKRDNDKHIIVTPMKSNDSKMNKSQTINLTTHSSLFTPKHPQYMKNQSASSSRACQKMEHMLDSFLKTKSYWEDIHVARSISKGQKGK